MLPAGINHAIGIRHWRNYGLENKREIQAFSARDTTDQGVWGRPEAGMSRIGNPFALGIQTI